MCRAKLVSGILLIAAVGCGRGEIPPAKEAKGDPPPAKWRFEAVGNIPFHLVPLQENAKEPRPEPAAAVDALFAGLARDKKTRELIVRLHGGAELTWVVEKMTEDASLEKLPKNPPQKGPALAWAITGWSPAPVPAEEEKFAPGRRLHMPVSISWTYLTRLDREQPNSVPVFVAAANDYLLRHNLGYQLKHAHLPARLEPMPGERRALAMVRAELDQTIEELAKNVAGPPKAP